MKELSQAQIDWLLKTTSITMDRFAYVYNEENRSQVIKVFLDYVLFDSCGPLDRRNFIEALQRQLDKV